jgi:hypothetical protein
VLILWVTRLLNLPVYGAHNAQIATILERWQEVWQENTVPYLALVQCLDVADVRRACQEALQVHNLR